jgi:type VI secretion system secreted protein VgrG
VASGAGSCRAFTPGYRFDLVEHRRGDLNGPYVLTQVSHSATNNLGDGEGATYDNTFTAVPFAVPVRPARVTPRPIVHGTQTAVVVGLPGEEIDTDKYARVKVQFHWDREGKRDHDSSCWIRVGTPWAGKQWGMVHIPRIGQEVIVAFLEGDPDRPIIVGSVYNAEHMPPYELPANKTQSGIKSRSSLNGTPENFNEFCFEDKKGEELVYLRAEKDYIQAVENDETSWVGRDRTVEVDRDDNLTVGRDRIEKVGRHQTVGVVGNRGETVNGDEDVTIKGNQKLTVAGDQTISVGGKRTVSVGGNDTLTVGGVKSITAGDAIVLSTGGAAIILKSDGTILIKGTDITILASGTITSRAGGVHTVKGSMVKINC